MLVKEKTELLKVIREECRCKTKAALAKLFGETYETDAQLFDELCRQSSLCNYNFQPYRVQYSNGTLKVFLYIETDSYFLFDVVDMPRTQAMVLKELSKRKLLAIYDEDWNVIDSAELDFKIHGTKICSMLMEMMYKDIAEMCELDIVPRDHITIKAGYCIRIKENSKSYGMHAVDEYPHPMTGIVAKGNYLVNAVGKEPETYSFKFRDYEMWQDDGYILYKQLSRFDILVPANISKLEYACMCCLGFCPAIYTGTFRILRPDNIELTQVLHVKGMEVQTNSKPDALLICGVTYRWHKSARMFLPVFEDCESVVYDAVVTDEETPYKGTDFYGVEDDRYIKVLKPIVTHTEVSELIKKRCKEMNRPYEIVRNDLLNVMDSRKIKNYDSLDEWQLLAHALELSTPTNEWRKQYFKDRYSTFIAECVETKFEQTVETINMFAKAYTRTYSFEEAPDAVERALGTLLYTAKEDYLLETGIAHLGAINAWGHLCCEDNNHYNVAVPDKVHCMRANQSMLQYYLKYQDDKKVQRLFELSQKTYTDFYHCL